MWEPQRDAVQPHSPPIITRCTSICQMSHYAVFRPLRWDRQPTNRVLEEFHSTLQIIYNHYKYTINSLYIPVGQLGLSTLGGETRVLLQFLTTSKDVKDLSSRPQTKYLAMKKTWPGLNQGRQPWQIQLARRRTCYLVTKTVPDKYLEGP